MSESLGPSVCLRVFDLPLVQVAYNVSFFAVVNVILLGAVVLGIVVDRFSYVRELQQKNDADELNVCFMCNGTRDKIERIKGGEPRAFVNHCNHIHNVCRRWNL